MTGQSVAVETHQIQMGIVTAHISTKHQNIKT